jgi:hypothetical protein
LALEIAAPLRSTNGVVRNSPADLRDEHRQPVVGSAENPWRAAQAWHRHRPDQRGQVHGSGHDLRAKDKDISSKSCGQYRRDGSFVVPTFSFRLLYGLLIMGHGRRQILWFGVTATTEWIANQLTEACGWEQISRYLIRDRDGAYGEIFMRRVRSISIRDRPTSPCSPSAKRLCKKADRLDPYGVHWSCRGVRRTPFAPRSAVVPRLLQRLAHPFVIEQGRANVTPPRQPDALSAVQS